MFVGAYLLCHSMPDAQRLLRTLAACESESECLDRYGLTPYAERIEGLRYRGNEAGSPLTRLRAAHFASSDQVAERKRKAEQFLRDVKDDPERADGVSDESVEH
jgi:hypothetical protein